jgi:hypothetical protein
LPTWSRSGPNTVLLTTHRPRHGTATRRPKNLYAISTLSGRRG